MATFRLFVHIYRSCRIFQYHGTRLFASCLQCLFCVVLNQFFAESIDKIFGSASDDELIRVLRGEADGVTNLIAPQSARSGNQHDIVLSHFHSTEWYHRRVFTFKLVHRNEFIEHTIVEHQQHGRVGRIILNAEEAFAGIIGFHIVHVRLGNKLLVLFPIGSESNTAVEEYFQVGPYLLQMLLAREFHHAHQNRQHPRRYTREVGHVFV